MKGGFPMKGLRDYQVFNATDFFKDKDLRVLATEPWNEFKEGQVTKELVTKYKCVIATDNTKYKNDIKDLNAGEQIVIKVEKQPKTFKKFSQVTLVNPTATIYGSFQSELSVKAEDVEIHQK